MGHFHSALIMRAKNEDKKENSLEAHFAFLSYGTAGAFLFTPK